MPMTLRAGLSGALLGVVLLLCASPRGARAEEAVAPLKLPPLWKTLDKEAKVATVSSDGKFVAAYEAQKWDVVVYRRDTGKEHFRIESRVGHSGSVRPAIIDDTVYYTTGWSNGQLWAFKVRPDLSAGEDTIQWQLKRSVPNKPVPVVRGDLIFMVSDGGVASCVDGLSGDVIWNERIGGNYSASPLLAGDRLYCLSEEGKTVVLAAGREFKLLAENQLPDGVMASPAVDGNALILRTKTQVYRVE